MGTTRSYDDQGQFGVAGFGKRLRNEYGVVPSNDHAMLAALQKLFDVPWPSTDDVKRAPDLPGEGAFMRS